MGSHPHFKKILDELEDLHKRKNSDYNPTDDPLANFKMCEAFGITAWKGVLVRITDKIARLQSFARKGRYQVDDEKVEDTLKDLAVYTILCLILYRTHNTEGEDESVTYTSKGEGEYLFRIGEGKEAL